MRTCKSLFFLLCSCILLFTIFSNRASAEDASINYDDINITQTFATYNSGTVDTLLNNVSTTSHYSKSFNYSSLIDGADHKYNTSKTYYSSGSLSESSFSNRLWYYKLKFSSISGNALLSSDKVYDISVSGIYNYVQSHYYGQNDILLDLNVNSTVGAFFYVVDGDGTKHTFAIDPDNYILSMKYNTELSLFLDLTDEEAVHGLITEFGIEFYFDYKTAFNQFYDIYWSTSNQGKNMPVTFFYGFSNEFSLTIDESIYVPEDDDSGIINGIINGIGGFFDDLGDGLAGIGESIANFPSLVLDGVKGLFVPDQEAFTDIKDQYDTMLRDRLGALYAGFDIVFVVAESISSADPTTTVYFPEVNIPLVGETFSFGGYDVELVPSGFEVLIDSLKVIVNIICTLLLINALKNRFMNLLGDRGGGDE